MTGRISFVVVFLLLAAVAAQATVRGVVVRRDTGQPYPGVQVVLHAGNNRSAPAFTDASGKFYLQNVPAGAYTMEVRSKVRTITIPVRVTGAAYTDVAKVIVE